MNHTCFSSKTRIKSESKNQSHGIHILPENDFVFVFFPILSAIDCV